MAEGAQLRGAHLAVVVPTKDRPRKLSNLLESLAVQTESVGRVVVVDGGKSVESVVEAFRGRVPVEYHPCQPPGQIRQRNLGLSLLDEGTPLVALLDDDIVMEAEAVERMMSFWRRTDPATAGVAFNIVNEPADRFSWVRWLLGLTARTPGRVLKSGLTTSVTHVAADARTQWLPGGATVWRREVLIARTHRPIDARWAIGEDLIFSYPVGKQRPLFVCASARVRHEHESDYVPDAARHRYHGRVQTLWMYRFVAENPDLSQTSFFVSLVLRMVGKAGQGLIGSDASSLEFVRGQASALGDLIRARIRGADPMDLLHDSPRARP